MSEDDRIRWDARHSAAHRPDRAAVRVPERFAAHEDAFPVAGRALDLACGTGATAVWLATRGLDVVGVDISPVAVEQARSLASASGVAGRCRFLVWDLDAGLPAGDPVDVLVCQRFRDARLDAAVLGRLVPGGLLAVVALSEVGAAPGRFRATPGELTRAFSGTG